MYFKASLAVFESYLCSYFTAEDKASDVRPGYNFFHIVFNSWFTHFTL